MTQELERGNPTDLKPFIQVKVDRLEEMRKGESDLSAYYLLARRCANIVASYSPETRSVLWGAIAAVQGGRGTDKVLPPTDDETELIIGVSALYNVLAFVTYDKAVAIDQHALNYRAESLGPSKITARVADTDGGMERIWSPGDNCTKDTIVVTNPTFVITDSTLTLEKGAVKVARVVHLYLSPEKLNEFSRALAFGTIAGDEKKNSRSLGRVAEWVTEFDLAAASVYGAFVTAVMGVITFEQFSEAANYAIQHEAQLNTMVTRTINNGGIPALYGTLLGIGLAAGSSVAGLMVASRRPFSTPHTPDTATQPQ